MNGQKRASFWVFLFFCAIQDLKDLLLVEIFFSWAGRNLFIITFESTSSQMIQRTDILKNVVNSRNDYNRVLFNKETYQKRLHFKCFPNFVLKSLKQSFLWKTYWRLIQDSMFVTFGLSNVVYLPSIKAITLASYH